MTLAPGEVNPMSTAAQLARFVQEELKKVADPEKAPQMQAYLKTDMPMYGVQKPDRVPIYREMKARFTPRNQVEYEERVLALWALPHREEKYAGITYACQHRDFQTTTSVPLYERLIREGAWWDFVDTIAIDLVGQVFLTERAAMNPVIDGYVTDDNMWIRRTALIAHNKHKGQTDEERLFDHCLRLAPEKEFFIRKAIGWALREYSKTAPGVVRGFLQENRDQLSGLSYREGAKHLVRAGDMEKGS